MLTSRRGWLTVPLWLWMLTAVAFGGLVGLEAWAWMRHGMSAVVLATLGAVSVGTMLLTALVIGAIGYGMISAISGWDPLRLGTASGGSGSGRCDSNYAGACLDPDAADYDCAGGSGDGPRYVGTLSVVGADVFGLDRDGDGVACE